MKKTVLLESLRSSLQSGVLIVKLVVPLYILADVLFFVLFGAQLSGHCRGTDCGRIVDKFHSPATLFPLSRFPTEGQLS